LVITAGFKDLLYIGNQARPKIFDLVNNNCVIILSDPENVFILNYISQKIEMPEVLYEEVVEVKVDCLYLSYF